MTRNQLRKIRLIFAILTVILFIAGGLSGMNDYQAWKQSNKKPMQPQINQSSGDDSASSIPPRTKKDESIVDEDKTDKGKAGTDQTDDGIIDILGKADSGSTDQESDTDENELPAVNGLENSQTGDVSKDNDKFVFSIVTLVLFIFGAISAAAAFGTSAVIYHRNVSLKKPDNANRETIEIKTVQVAQQSPVCAQFNQLGKRSRQEDCCGVLPMDSEMLAVVADGMGGLKNGGRVSELVVRSMLEQGQLHRGSSENDILLPMLHTTNETVNRSLGADIYKSGSTMLAVWIQDKGKRFQWAAVGDSRIYLYRGGGLIQLNQEHNYGQELLHLAVKGQISFEEARKNPKKGELTSFIGMGQLKYVNYSVRPIDLQAGDRILLMSDGVFNAVTDQKIAQVLLQNADVQAAADQLVYLIEQFNNPKQDNFTAVILGF